MSPMDTAARPTIGDKLDNHVKRWRGQLTLSRIPADEPLVRALLLKRRLWQADEDLAGVGLDASRERDIAYDAMEAADTAWADAIQDLWDLRRLAVAQRNHERNSMQEKAA